ncbi:MAG: CesT family type III secretion system chaperone [Methylacidiphilales bacterium]|nr:CesT family type III secretion system chaperone [Candidatus Methylacidiphilales bacterium]NJR14479.1 CesT family type III secretion system chaperone [Calothrix sp. CSU_2_0]
MKPTEIESVLTDLFGGTDVNNVASGSWQVETENFRLLILLSDDTSWLRILLPIVPIQEAQPFLEQLLEANFDDTHSCRYALHQNVVWGVFQHNTNSLTTDDFEDAIAQLISLHEAGLNDVFNNLIESRIRLIVTAAKQQGQSLAATMQNLERFYAEGLMGEIEQSSEAREQTLATWRYQLERLWNEEEENL